MGASCPVLVPLSAPRVSVQGEGLGAQTLSPRSPWHQPGSSDGSAQAGRAQQEFEAELPVGAGLRLLSRCHRCCCCSPPAPGAPVEAASPQ